LPESPSAEQIRAAKIASMAKAFNASEAFQNKKFVEAQQFAETALAHDPHNDHAASLLVKSVYAQFPSGPNGANHREMVLAVVAAYRRAIPVTPTNPSAQRSIGWSMFSVGGWDLQRQWWMEFATDSNLPKVERAYAYEQLASIRQCCAFPGIPDRVPPPGYSEPIGPMIQCALDGLSFLDQSLALIDLSYSAWTTKFYLLGRLAELAEMEGRSGDAAEYRRQREAAERRVHELEAKRG
jgi:hypothetical protein